MILAATYAGLISVLCRLITHSFMGLHLQALNEISELYFAIPPPRAQQGNPMADMLSAMLGGGPPTRAAAPKRVLAPAPASAAPSLD